MSTTTNELPPRLADIIADFEMAEGQEKLDILLEFSEQLPPLPDWLHGRRDNMEQVHECMTPTFLHTELENGGLIFYFDIPPEAPTVRGYAAVLAEGLHGATPEQVLQVPPDLFYRMGIQQVLSPQRLNGIAALLGHIKRQAMRHA
jgi:cysteine desulfuration protein SufE